MKKIIRLTESDLARIVKRVIRENDSDTPEKNNFEEHLQKVLEEVGDEGSERIYLALNGYLYRILEDYKYDQMELDESMEVNGDPQSMLESMIDEIGEQVIENSYFGSLTEDDMEGFASTVSEEATDKLQEEGFSNMSVDYTIYHGGNLEFYIFDNYEEGIVATYRPDF